MKALSRYIFIYLIAASVLVSGNGVVLAIHTCLSSKTKEITLFTQSGCCSKKALNCNIPKAGNAGNLNSKCCASEYNYYKITSPFLPQKQVGFWSIPKIIYHVFSVIPTGHFDCITYNFN